MSGTSPPPFLDRRNIEAFHLYLKIVNGRLRVGPGTRSLRAPLQQCQRGGRPRFEIHRILRFRFSPGKLSLARIKASLQATRTGSGSWIPSHTSGNGMPRFMNEMGILCPRT